MSVYDKISPMKQHFNYLRNNSSEMTGILTWDCSYDIELSPLQSGSLLKGDTLKGLKEDKSQHQVAKTVSFKEQTHLQKETSKSLNMRRVDTATQKSSEQRDLGKSKEKKISVPSVKRTVPDDGSVSNVLQRIRQRDASQQVQRKAMRKEKVKKYIEQLAPYTRSLSNTKYQQYFDRAALQSYGRANTTEPIGGIIYGNNLKTHNANPHIYNNKPKYYQTHQCAINFSKRTKLCVDEKWDRLEKELTKKLGLADRNETYKQGKEVIVVQVNPENMDSIIRDNRAFQKAHADQIREKEKEYNKEKENEKQAAVDEFYKQKAERIAAALKGQGELIKLAENTRDPADRLYEQVIYKQVDQHGHVRMGADRHAMTCFVDRNIPESDAMYTCYLNTRAPIFPQPVSAQDGDIDSLRKRNCKISHTKQLYPSHYLTPKNDQPEVLKMMRQKYLTNKSELRTMASLGDIK